MLSREFSPYFGPPMNLLLLSVTFPYPPTGGGTQTRTFHLLKALAAHHCITLVTQRPAHATDADLALDVAALTEILAPQGGSIQLFAHPDGPDSGIEDEGTPRPAPLAKLKRLGQSILGTPAHIRHWHNPEMQAWLDRAIASGHYDALTCEHSVNAVFVRSHWSLPTILNVHSSAYRTSESQLKLGTAENPRRDRLLLPALRRYERSLYRQFQQIVVTTEEDAQSVRDLEPNAAIAVIPNGVDLAEFSRRDQEPPGRQLIFTGGMDYNVNIDTARHLALDILPLVQQRYSDVSLALVGSKPDPIVQSLAGPGIIVTGRVPSLATSLHGALLFVAPMRLGFGIKNKTLEALAAGVPVIGSDRALEGLPDGVALRANGIAATVAAIGQLLDHPDQRQALAERGRAVIEAQFTWKAAGDRYSQIVTQAAQSRRNTSPAPSSDRLALP